MVDKVLLSGDDPRFPVYFRLYWPEVTTMVNPRPFKDLFRNLAKILEEDTKNDWYTYAFNALCNTEKIEAEVVKFDKTLELRRPTPEEKAMKLKQTMAPEYERKLSTFQYEVMFNAITIAYLDKYNELYHRQLWRATLCGYREDAVSVQTSFKHFYPQENREMLDGLVMTFCKKNLTEFIASRPSSLAAKFMTSPETECGSKLGDVCKIAGAYFPVLNASSVQFQQRLGKNEEEQEVISLSHWKRIHEQLFYVATLQETDLRTMLNALKNSVYQAPIELRLEEALTRVSAEYIGDISSIKDENERAERVRSRAVTNFEWPTIEALSILDDEEE